MNNIKTPEQFHTENAMALVDGGTQSADMFTLSFNGIPENFKQALDISVKSVSPPRFRFSSTPQRGKGYTYNNKGDFVVSDMTVTFTADAGGVVRNIIMTQILRQLNKATDVFGQDTTNDQEGRQYTFGVTLHTINSDNKVSTSLSYDRCFITDVDFGTFDRESNQVMYITVVIALDQASVEFSEDFFANIELTGNDSRLFKLTQR